MEDELNELRQAHNQMMRDTRKVRFVPALLILATSSSLIIAFNFGALWLEVFVYLGLAFVVWTGVKAAFVAGMIAAYRDAGKRFEQLRVEAVAAQIDQETANPLRVVGPS